MRCEAPNRWTGDVARTSRRTTRVRVSIALASLAACRAPLEPIPLDEVARLEPAVQLQAEGAPIDVTDLRGYAGPAVLDGDGDGLLDLFVGSFSGQIRFHRNVGTRTAPVFAKGELLRSGGEPIRISNW